MKKFAALIIRVNGRNSLNRNEPAAQRFGSTGTEIMKRTVQLTVLSFPAD
ncbi:MAG: hypothetical protein MR022_06135 [Ruminococcus sp.]|nr:hypothetical protein [Ruminococcus sp.]